MKLNFPASYDLRGNYKKMLQKTNIRLLVLSRIELNDYNHILNKQTQYYIIMMCVFKVMFSRSKAPAC